jgi:transporter family protein
MAPASRVAPIDKLSVALVIVLAVIVLGEALTWQVALGGGLVVAGVLVLALA